MAVGRNERFHYVMLFIIETVSFHVVYIKGEYSMDSTVAKHSQHTWRRVEEVKGGKGKVKVKDIIGEPLPLGYLPQKKRFVDIGDPLPLENIRSKPKVRERYDFGSPLPLPYLTNEKKNVLDNKIDIKRDDVGVVKQEMRPVEGVIDTVREEVQVQLKDVKQPIDTLLEVIEQLESENDKNNNNNNNNNTQAKLLEAVERLERLIPKKVEKVKETVKEDEVLEKILAKEELVLQEVRSYKQIGILTTLMCLVWISYLLAD